MNQTENNMISCLKTSVFMFFCLLAFSAGANRDSDYDSFRGNVLTAEVQPIPSQAILTPANDGMTAIHPVTSPDNKSQFSVMGKLAFDCRLFNQRFITLRKSRETIIPLHVFRYYLPVIPANPDDLPDLS
jgi:hypothetical protein